MYSLNEVKLGREINKKPDANKFIWSACSDCGEPRWILLNVKENRPDTSLCRKCAGLLRRGEKRGPAHNRLSLVGQRFTRLVVLNFMGIQENSHRESLWLCKCDCGKETVTTGYSLTSGNTKSCGCYHRDRTRELFSIPNDTLGLNRVFMDYRKWAGKKNRLFGLSKDQVKTLITSDCYYCGAKPGNEIGLSRGIRFTYQGIDRLDNSKGYTPGNVVPCCIICNKMKKAMSHDEFILHLLKIAEKFEVKPPQPDFQYEVSPAELVL